MNENKEMYVELNPGFYPVDYHNLPDLSKAKKYDLAELSSLTGAGSAIANAVLQLTANEGTLVRAVLPKGLELAKAKDGIGLRGWAMQNGQFAAQAHLIPVADFAALSTVTVSVAVVALVYKLNKIEEGQKKMMSFFKEEKQAKLRGNLKMLNEIFENYQNDPNNDEYRKAMLVEIQSIKKEALQDIEHYETQISKGLSNKKKIGIEMNIDNNFAEIETHFKYYKVALYEYSFASMVEATMLESFSHENAEMAVKRIKEKTFAYETLYANAYDLLRVAIGSSIESKVRKGVAAVTKNVGKFVDNTPISEKTTAPEKLYGLGEKIEESTASKRFMLLREFAKFSDAEVIPFMENIQLLDGIYNGGKELYFDNKFLYVQDAV